MVEKINKHYKPQELNNVIEVLKANDYHNFSHNDATGIVMALYRLGFRIVNTNKEL